MEINGRYDHIEDVLCFLHGGCWYDWSDPQNKIYANLILPEKMGINKEWVNNPYSKPSEESLTDALAKQQSDFDSQEYARNRATEYPAITEQLDEIFHNGIDSWKAVISLTKDKYPKG